MQRREVKREFLRAHFETTVVAAAIPGCRRAGLPSPAEKAAYGQKAFEIIDGGMNIHAHPGGRDATLYVRQGCLTLH